jgi:hypothetical protein
LGRKLCPKLILEGTRLTLKTELAFTLNEHPRVVGPRNYRYHSPIISGEWCAFTDIPWGRGMVNYLPEEESLAMETFATYARLFELQRYYSWIVDRFHVSTRLYQRQAGRRDPDFIWLEDRIRPLGYRHILCVRSPDGFAAAREERLKVSGNPRQYDDLGVFIREQDHYRQLVRESSLPFLELDVASGDLPALADRVADWLEATGGLSAPWTVAQ